MQELNGYSQKTQIWNLVHHQFDINEIKCHISAKATIEQKLFDYG